MTIAGRVNIAVGCEFVINYHADKLGLSDDIKILTPNLFSREPLYLAFSKEHPDYKKLTSSFSNALEQLFESGEIERIHNKFNLNY